MPHVEPDLVLTYGSGFGNDLDYLFENLRSGSNLDAFHRCYGTRTVYYYFIRYVVFGKVQPENRSNVFSQCDVRNLDDSRYIGFGAPCKNIHFDLYYPVPA